MNDELLTALCADLDAFVGEPGPPPQRRPAPEVPADRPRRPWLALAAAAATIAVVVAGLAVIARRDDPDVGDAPLPAATMPVPPTPDGWTVVEWGDLRISLTPDLDPFGAECTTAPSEESITIDCGGDAQLTFARLDAGAAPEATETRLVNGLTQHVRASRSDEARIVDLPEIDVRVTLPPGTAADISIADTIGVSTRWRALNEPAPRVPVDWQTVTYQGISLRVPADWPVASWLDPEPRFCLQAGDVVRPGVFLERGPVSDAEADCAGPPWLTSPTDGVRIYVLDSEVDLSTLPIGERVLTGDRGQQILVRVGFGVDGTIGRTILGSITGPDAPAPTVTTAPATPPNAMPVPVTPDGWQVVEWGDVRVSLPPHLGVGSGPECESNAPDESRVEIRCDTRSVTIISGTAGTTLDDTSTVVRNGLTTELMPVPDLDGPMQLAIGETLSLVRFTGFSADEIAPIIDTVGVSSGWRAFNEPPPPVPDDWQIVEFDGFSFRVPADWPVSELAPPEIDPDVCGFAGVSGGVTIGRGSLDASTVNCAAGRALVLPTDGVRVYPVEAGKGPLSLGNPYISRVIGSAASRQVVVIGLGGDGTIGHTILGSMEEESPQASPTTLAGPPVTSATGVSSASEHASIGMVIEDGEGVQLCLVVLTSLPPQCGAGFRLDGFDWDTIDGEQSVGGGEEIPATTWLGDVFVRGTWDEAEFALSVTAASAAAEADRDLLVQMQAAIGEAGAEPDYSLPCEPPSGGWDRPATDPILSWPGEQVAALAGYAGSWIDPETWVFTAKFTGDVADAEAKVRALYGGPVCVVGARHDEAELGAIATELRSLSSVQVLESAVYVDATGEWVAGTTILPTPALQASLDDRYGEGTVRLRSYLIPVP